MNQGSHLTRVVTAVVSHHGCPSVLRGHEVEVHRHGMGLDNWVAALLRDRTTPEMLAHQRDEHRCYREFWSCLVARNQTLRLAS
jgi:hypothetical protein